MKSQIGTISCRSFAVLAIALGSACASIPSVQAPARGISSNFEPSSAEIEAKRDSTPSYRGCENGVASTMSQRSAILEQAVRQAEGELKKSPLNVKDPDFRARIATFAAANIDDKVPLISMDRSCWAEFYEGQKKLAAGDEAGAKENGDAWRICLEAMFPDRIEIARPYFTCFNPEAGRPSTPSEL